MTVQYYPTNFTPIAPETLADFAAVPAAVASDCLPTGQTMQGAISGLDPTMRLCAQARTVDCPAGDNSAIRAAIGLVRTGEAIVATAQGGQDVAVFGGMMTLYAKERGVAGLVIDGAVRDSDEIVEADLPMFTRATCPKGPVQNGVGRVDVPVNVGGVRVCAGDLIIADADGVTVVPLALIDTTLVAAQTVLQKEAQMLEDLQNGGTMAQVYGAAEVETIHP